MKMKYSRITRLTVQGFTDHLFEVGNRKELLDPGQEVRYEGLEGGVKPLVKHLLEDKHRGERWTD